MELTTKTLAKRFAAKCSKPDANGCIHWLGCRTQGGYGLIRLGSKNAKRTTAQRAAWIIKHGDLSPDAWVLHKCDTPSCVNVDHLFLGTPADNTDDMVRKGRHGWKRGTPWQKLCATDAERIRDLRKAGSTQQAIADWLGVSRPLISMVLSGKFSYSQSVSTA